jgi:hypothetical protein
MEPTMQTTVIVPLRSPPEQHEPKAAAHAETAIKRPISSLSFFVKDVPGRPGTGWHFWMPDKLGQGFVEANNRGQDMAIECVEYAIGADMLPVIRWATCTWRPMTRSMTSRIRAFGAGSSPGSPSWR